LLEYKNGTLNPHCFSVDCVVDFKMVQEQPKYKSDRVHLKGR